jgi:type III restriction enzyme
LKQSGSDVRKRQEIGRGLRLCVNQDGERMDANVLGADVHNINVLTVIASESYDQFAKGLQTEIAEAVADRPRKVEKSLFVGRTITDNNNVEYIIDEDMADDIQYSRIVEKYIDSKGQITEKFYEDEKADNLKFSDAVVDYAKGIVEILKSVYDAKAMMPEDARKNNIELHVDESKMAMPEFKELWNKINSKSVYVVDFDSDELVKKSIAELDAKLRVAKIRITVQSGSMEKIDSKAQIASGDAMKLESTKEYDSAAAVSSSVKYDLVGKLVEATGLTRKDIVRILTGIQPFVFEQFKYNPEEFIIKAGNLINDQKATAIIEHITYNVVDEKYDTDIFTEPTIKGKLGTNAMKANRHLYDHIVYDSTVEKEFAEKLDTCEDVAVYVKLPNGFYINTPVGHYNPDWAISFKKGTVKHIYFVAETKGSMDTLQLKGMENSKIHCAREHFKAISSDEVKYDVVNTYEELMNILK